MLAQQVSFKGIAPQMGSFALLSRVIFGDQYHVWMFNVRPQLVGVNYIYGQFLELILAGKKEREGVKNMIRNKGPWPVLIHPGRCGLAYFRIKTCMKSAPLCDKHNKIHPLAPRNPVNVFHKTPQLWTLVILQPVSWASRLQDVTNAWQRSGRAHIWTKSSI